MALEEPGASPGPHAEPQRPQTSKAERAAPGPSFDREVSVLFARVQRELLASRRTPLSTYRVQLHAGFRFEDVRALVPYLASLGVSDLYSSPYLMAAPGSTHGYDCVDHGKLNPEIGTEVEHDALCQDLRRHGLGLLLDFVPNHMGIGHCNPRWMDVLENGPSSRYARYFDIEWNPVMEELRTKVLLPILGDQYGAVLERGELSLRYDAGAFYVAYHDHRFPIALRQYARVLGLRLDQLEKQLGVDHPDFVELQSILTALTHLPDRTDTSEEKIKERSREKEVIKRRLAQVVAANPVLQRHVTQNVETVNGRVGDPRSFDLLDQILSGGSYRLAHWRVAGEEINYRRFFDINSLAAIRVEDPFVFDESHALVFRLLDEGRVTGLRIDHPDGLFDPTAYFLDLQERYFLQRARRHLMQEGEAADPRVLEALRALYRAEVRENEAAPLRRALYVVVEKITEGRERLPEAWAVHGTTGYRAANTLTGLFVDAAAEQSLTGTYARFIGVAFDYEQLLYEKKRLVMSASLSSEINVLARELNRISEMNRHSRDFTLNSLRRALVEFVARFPVYRTYVDGRRPELDGRDVHYIDWTIAKAKRHDQTLNASIYDFLRDILLRRYPDRLNERERATMLRFAMKLQQVTGPAMAKGLEDTVFYIYNRLLALNEVGGEPDRFGTSLQVFHERNAERAQAWPGALIASSTHDTKRSEDVRARLAVLSELPDAWAEAAARWALLTRSGKTTLPELTAPSPNDEYFFYQSVVGAYPMGPALSGAALDAFRGRLCQYMQKAVREAKVHTSWVNPDADYERAVSTFVERALHPDTGREFLDEVYAFKARLERAGQLNSLSQVLLKVASPGVPDTYQGCELWDLSLVDPDNRRPVDFEHRRRLLEDLDREAESDRESLCHRLWGDPTDGSVKLYLLSRALRLRKRLPDLFRRGGYLSLAAEGPRRDQVVAFARVLDNVTVVAVTPRHVARLLEGQVHLSAAFEGTAVVVPGGWSGEVYRDVLTGKAVTVERRKGVACLDVGALFSVLPLALLEKRSR